jgi:hypothetical protein
LVIIDTPSSSSTSKAYSICSSDPSTSGSGSAVESAEPVGALAFEVRQVLVDATRERPCRRVVPEVHAWRADRRDRDVDPRLVEVCDRTIETPARGSDPSCGIPILIRGEE